MVNEQRTRLLYGKNVKCSYFGWGKIRQNCAEGERLRRFHAEFQFHADVVGDEIATFFNRHQIFKIA